MNIAEAGIQVENAVRAYFAKDEYGGFIIPQASQRPLFLMGPPGIGKTAIVSQIAAKLGVGLVSYSMTHHTRQSALGLPLIKKKDYGGTEYDITEYTMSEIIASVYELMEESGVSEGILFLDEINCVSETLTPMMLQFLQFKTFGRHALPGGWIVVTAGNPPEYNRSARQFDIVTWDRLKRIDIEPSYPAWREYAVKKGVHPAVLTYLDAKKDCFYKVEAGAEGAGFVTARGWDDLSDMIRIYEALGIGVDPLLMPQYLQNKELAEDFALYYELFNKYRSDYRIGDILSGNASDEIKTRAKNAPFDERLSLLGLLLDKLYASVREVVTTEDELKALLVILRELKSGAELDDKLNEQTEELLRLRRRGAVSREEEHSAAFITDFLKKHQRLSSGFADIKADFDASVARLKASAQSVGEELEHLFSFCEELWSDGQELLILVTELSAGYWSARFISRYGCDAYYRHSDELMFYERHTEIIKQLERLEPELG